LSFAVRYFSKSSRGRLTILGFQTINKKFRLKICIKSLEIFKRFEGKKRLSRNRDEPFSQLKNKYFH
jgi:hypothetical protein